MLKDNTNFAILFKRNFIEDYDLELLIPFRVLIGETDEKATVFHDYLANSLYINADLGRQTKIDEVFGEVTTYKELKQIFKSRDLKTIFSSYLDSLKKCAFLYEDDSFTYDVISMQELYEDYDIVLDYIDDNELLNIKNSLINGEEDGIKNLIEAYGEEEKQESKFVVSKISEVCDSIKENVISQDEAVRKIVTSIFKNNVFEDTRMKSNILLYGPTGVGKTEIVRNVGKIFDVPVLVEDMTRYTVAGYVGADLENMLAKLYLNADKNLELAERSILVLDEIDKKAANSGDSSSINKEDVLKSLLKIIEGGVFDVKVSNYEKINFDTSKLTIIASGAFSDIYETKKSKRTLGFASSDTVVEPTTELSMDDFVKFGMPPEFMGRFDTIVKMNSLEYKDMIKILKESNLSPLKMYLDNLKMLGVDLKISDNIYELIAKKAVDLKTGARGLKVVVDGMFGEILYGMFDNPGTIEELEIGPETVSDSKKFKFTMKKQESN